MKAHLRSARLAPKKANLVAAMVRRMRAEEALAFLERLPKKGARMLHALISSALANAEHNSGQERSSLTIKSLTVQKAPAFRRYVPMARGRSRPIDKWTSHITVELGVVIPEGKQPAAAAPTPASSATKAVKKSPKKEEEVAQGAVAHVDAPPTVGPSAPAEKRAGEDPHGRGFKHGGPSGPTFQPHHRGGRGT